jgi:hypothetical protein
MNRKSKTKYGEKFPMTRPIAQIREELKQKKPESKKDVGQPGDGLVQPLPGEQRELTFMIKRT